VTYLEMVTAGKTYCPIRFTIFRCLSKVPHDRGSGYEASDDAAMLRRKWGGGARVEMDERAGVDAGQVHLRTPITRGKRPSL